jgi:hypothetical protein
MNERDIELAKQAGLKTYQEQAPGLDGMVGSWEAIAAFADLIRADEREACAKVCDEVAESRGDADECATEIRGRRNT